MVRCRLCRGNQSCLLMGRETSRGRRRNWALVWCQFRMYVVAEFRLATIQTPRVPPVGCAEALAVFDLKAGATAPEIEAAYKAAVNAWHPDRFSSADMRAELPLKRDLDDGGAGGEAMANADRFVRSIWALVQCQWGQHNRSGECRSDYRLTVARRSP